MNNQIIIIGGMGPQASLELHKRVLSRAAHEGAKQGHEYPEIHHISLPARNFISDRSLAMAASGIRCISPGISEVGTTEGLIRKVIANERVSSSKMAPVIQSLVARGAEKVILGCTELSVIGPAKDLAAITIDPMDLATIALLT